MSRDDDGRIGPFPNWRSVYVTVIVYGLVVIALLTLLTQVLSFGAGS